MKLVFAGAAQTVTGSQTLVRHGSYAALVDCGLYQGPKELRTLNWVRPDYFSEVRAMILTHAHIDHSGMVPRWAHWGWKGPVYCTPLTAELLEIMLLDAGRLQEEDARYANKTGYSHHHPALPLYTERDAEAALRLLKPVEFEKWTELNEAVQFRFLRAGHILGSAMVQMAGTNGGAGPRVVTFSGDIGGGHSDVLKDPVAVNETDALVLESTYGDRRVNAEGREERLAEVVRKVIGRGGTLVIPAFAVGRTQDLLVSLYRLTSQKLIPEVPIYLDSPMARKVTELYLRNREDLRPDAPHKVIEEALSSSFFRGVESPDESMLLAMSDDPKIIISASGMLQGGRVMHHLKRVLPGEKNGVLFIGFQGRETKGRLLVDGISKLRLHHQEYPVEAEIFSIDGYSAHADVEDMVAWVKRFQRGPERIFLNHGELEAQEKFAERLKKEFGVPVEIPKAGEGFEV